MKKLITILMALFLATLLACGSPDPDPTPKTSKLAGFTDSELYLEEHGPSKVTLSGDDIVIENETGKGGYVVMWDKPFDFRNFEMKFKVSIDKLGNNQNWIGFAFTNVDDDWYDQAYSVLVLFRLEKDEDGNLTGKAAFNIVTVIYGFSMIEAPATEVTGVDLYTDGRINEFKMEYYAAPVNDYGLFMNDTQINVVPGEGNEANSTENFGTIYNAMEEGKAYLNFATKRTESDGSTVFTICEINGAKAKSLVD